MRAAQSPDGGKIWERVKASRDCREWVRAVKGIEGRAGSGDADSLSSSGDRINRSVRCVGVVGVSSLCITQMKSGEDGASRKATVDSRRKRRNGAGS